MDDCKGGPESVLGDRDENNYTAQGKAINIERPKETQALSPCVVHREQGSHAAQIPGATLPAAATKLPGWHQEYQQGLGEGFDDLGGCKRPIKCGVRCVLSSWGAENASEGEWVQCKAENCFFSEVWIHKPRESSTKLRLAFYFSHTCSEIILRSLKSKTSPVKTTTRMECATLKNLISVTEAVPLSETHVISWPRKNALLRDTDEIIYRICSSPSGFCSLREKGEKHPQSSCEIKNPFHPSELSCWFSGKPDGWMDKSSRKKNQLLARAMQER
ncbi:uncharacterized protein LOC135297840 [Passer domesticus]|uniref:uncharacterized protein LOC135297840 n=1 Tax=Passer domesticus TaxID=48849 RepID=UPI0030FEFBBA